MSIPASSAPCCFIATVDRASAKAFYAGVLGLRVLGEDDHAVTFDAGNRTPLRLSDVPAHTAATHTVMGWLVGDIRATVRALAAKGVAFKTYDGFGQDADGIWQSPGGGAQIAWFTDPDNNLLSLTQFG